LTIIITLLAKCRVIYWECKQTEQQTTSARR